MDTQIKLFNRNYFLDVNVFKNIKSLKITSANSMLNGIHKNLSPSEFAELYIRALYNIDHGSSTKVLSYTNKNNYENTNMVALSYAINII